MPIIELSYQSGPNVECGMCASHAFFGLSGGENRNHPSPSVINLIFIYFIFVSSATIMKEVPCEAISISFNFFCNF